jgi:DNA-binding PadR family transcriptional regulator
MREETLNPTAASLLGFLHHGAASGWDLAAKAQTTIGEFWNVTRSQVYRELKLLERQGYIAARGTGARDRQPYHLTAAGQAAFAAWIRGYRGRFLMRWPLALTVYFGQHLDPDDLRRACADYRQEHVRMAATIESFGTELRRVKAGHVLEILRLGAGFHRLVIDWIDTLPWMVGPGSAARGSRSQGKRQRRRGVQRA